VNSRQSFSPRRYARICGALYLYIIIAGTFAALFVRAKLVVSNDAAATARNILANETLFRIGFSGELLHIAFDVIVAVLLYALLRPVDRNIALIAAFMRLACDIVLAVSSLSHFATLRLLGRPDYLSSFGSDQLQSLALLSMRMHGDGYAISLVFFGFCCLSLGYLVYRSTFLPRTIGVLLAIGGVCYLANSFAHFLHPPFVSEALFVPIFIAESSFALWLLAKGVNVGKWEAAAAGEVEVLPPG
jgi:hypothetical protein